MKKYIIALNKYTIAGLVLILSLVYSCSSNEDLIDYQRSKTDILLDSLFERVPKKITEYNDYSIYTYADGSADTISAEDIRSQIKNINKSKLLQKKGEVKHNNKLRADETITDEDIDSYLGSSPVDPAIGYGPKSVYVQRMFEGTKSEGKYIQAMASCWLVNPQDMEIRPDGTIVTRAAAMPLGGGSIMNILPAPYANCQWHGLIYYRITVKSINGEVKTKSSEFPYSSYKTYYAL